METSTLDQSNSYRPLIRLGLGVTHLALDLHAALGVSWNFVKARELGAKQGLFSLLL